MGTVAQDRRHLHVRREGTAGFLRRSLLWKAHTSTFRPKLSFRKSVEIRRKSNGPVGAGEAFLST
jgi:hypothetical protein